MRRPSKDGRRTEGVEPGGLDAPDAVEAALGGATVTGRRDVVAQLARELEARRIARAGNVIEFARPQNQRNRELLFAQGLRSSVVLEGALLRLRRAPALIALGVLLLAAPSPARAGEDRETDSPSPPFHWRLGAGMGGSWLPLGDGSIAMAVGRASVGFDYGRYSLRASPTFQYGTIAENSDRWKIALGYVALENVFRITPDYAMSLSPLAGYGSSPDPTPGCTDVCSEPIGNGLTLGADASPATFIFGDDRAFELGVHADIFVFTNGAIWPGTYLDFRWMFASVDDRVAGQ